MTMPRKNIIVTLVVLGLVLALAAPSQGVTDSPAATSGAAQAPTHSSKPAKKHHKRRHLVKATASWYGPGFYGNRTACGQTLTTSTVGVANKHLPCGYKVLICYHRRCAKFPVIDRGPYAAGRSFDFTAPAKRKIGFGSTGTVRASRK